MSTNDGVSTAGEAFIPFVRQDLVEMCLADGKLPADHRPAFRRLTELLTTTVHFEFLHISDEVKRHYAPFDPDRETVLLDNSEETRTTSRERILKVFHSIAHRANCFEIDREQIREYIDSPTLIELRTSVDLDDFKQVICYGRGDVFKTTDVRGFLRRRKIKADVLQRVLLLLECRDDEPSPQKDGRKKVKTPQFQPGKIYTFLYKDVPKFDLELLFPNVKVGMKLKDKLMFGVPAIGGAVGVLFKTIPQIVILAGVILFLVGGHSWSRRLGVTEETMDAGMPILTALMGVVIALGGLAFKQWTSYRKKRVEFLKEVSEQLFFRNLATNRSVFHRIIDSAEEEETKEMILVLYHLMTWEGEAPDRMELDQRIEAWMKAEFETTVDFDIDGPLATLARVRGTLPDGRVASMVETDEDGRLHALSLEEAGVLLGAQPPFGLRPVPCPERSDAE